MTFGAIRAEAESRRAEVALAAKQGAVAELAFASGPGGEHAMLVGREGAHPTEKDLLELAQSADLKRPRPIIEQVREAVGRFAQHADAVGLPARVKRDVAKALGVDPVAARAKTPRSR